MFDPHKFCEDFKILLLWPLVVCLSITLVQANNANLEQLQLIEASMNPTIHACENFYAHACGKWTRNHAQDFSANLGEFLQFNHTSKMMDLVVRKYPEERLKNKQTQKALDKAAIYLHSCLKERSFDVWKYLDEVKPGPGLEWPLLAKDNQTGDWSQFDPFALMGRLHSYGLNTAIMEQLTVRDNGSVLTVLTIPDARDFEREAIDNLLLDLKLPQDVRLRQLDELHQTHDYWEAAFKDYADYGESENFFSYDDMKQDNPQMNRFLDYVIPPERREGNALVAIPFWDYISFLLARHWQPYENQKFCNYLMVKFLLHLKEATASGCLTTTQQRMHLAIDYLYYRHYYGPQARQVNQHLSGLTRIIHKQLLVNVRENHLNFSSEQVRAIRSILGNIAINIGNLPERVNLSAIEDFYRFLPVFNLSNFYANDLAMMKHRMLESWNCPSSMSCEEDIKSVPHNYFENDLLIIPFAALQLPLYDRQLDPLLLLSSLGTLMTHEFTHSIDVETLPRNVDYSTLFASVLQQADVKESLSCMQHQHATDSINERIADLIGARVAYGAYVSEHQQSQQPSFASIPWKKLFFLNMAQIFCANSADVEIAQAQAMRLNQIAKNLEVFAEAFDCPVGSKMNPLRKCRFY
uniref:Peptidase M13 N-terminal domain-containing protein n=1 Tax=Stomoxys calcitrans TaxID=35570 RepID=A0A1I8NXJ9_STOCA